MVRGSARPISESLRYTTIYVDGYDDKILVGRLRHGQCGSEKQFHGLMQLLLFMESALRENEFPAEYMQPRRFCPVDNTPAQNGTDIAEENSLPGKLATFRLKIIFRQNAGWQGTVCWVNGRQEQAFRSVLELAMLLDSALEHSIGTLEVTA